MAADGAASTVRSAAHHESEPAADVEKESSHHESDTGEEDDDEANEEEREPTLKYTKLTSHLAPVYRNGDSTSSFQVTADKLIIGTHNGVVHVYTLPALQPLRQYRAHSSTITAISVSPSSSAFTATPQEDAPRSTSNLYSTPKREPPGSATASPKSPRQQPLPATPSNAIYIGTASIDGHVCVSSLIDAKDVTLRNYSRPVHAVALSPSFKTDRTYLSGGTAGNLICTIGGKAGVSSDANTNSAAAAASGWLDSIGLGSNTGKDTAIHSGEGTISSITWSTTGKYVAWNNEYGTRIMLSHLDTADSDLAWKRIGHVPRPNRKVWEDMAGVWKARTQWIDPAYLEHDVAEVASPNGVDDSTSGSASPAVRSAQTSNGVRPKSSRKRFERLLVGWGDSVWVVHVHNGKATSGHTTASARAEIAHQFRFDDCIVSGLTLYSPSILAALVFRTVDDDDNPIHVTDDNGKARRGRRNGLPPDLRLIDLSSTNKDELEAESVVVSRFERLTFADYHLSSLYVPPAKPSTQSHASRGTLELLGGGLKEVGLTTTRFLSSGASVLSGSSGDQTVASSGQAALTRTPTKSLLQESPPALLTTGLKIFIHSPFDCVLAIRRDLGDQLAWQLEHQEYETAWNLVRNHPEIVSPSGNQESRPSTPTRSNRSLAEFFDDASSQITAAGGKSNGSMRDRQDLVEQELQRIGDLWIDKLVQAGAWEEAGSVAGKSLRTSRKWEDWILVFARNEKFDEIVPHIPSDHLKPPLPSYVYEVVLAHFVTHDRIQLQSLLDQWSVSLFDSSAVAKHVETYLKSGEVRADTTEGGTKGRDWHILLDCLAKLYLADARPAEAIDCYLKVRHADAVLEIIREYAKIDAIADHIWDFVTLEPLTEGSLNTASAATDLATPETMTMLTTAAVQGVIDQETVITQLQAKAPASDGYLFLYFRQHWRPESLEGPSGGDVTSDFVSRSRFAQVEAVQTPSRALLVDYANEVVTSFATYSQPLLNDFLKATRDYDFEHASDECRKRHYVPELVYLLQKTGQTKTALYLIIDELGDVGMAIAFVRETNDESLWNDLLDYSMDKPEFIRGMLEDAGSSIDPVTLVKKIPVGLSITGLKSSLAKLLRESEITWSISDGASKVLQNEISTVMNELRRRRGRGVAFGVAEPNTDHESPDPTNREATKQKQTKPAQGHCMSCNLRYDESEEDGPGSNDEHLIGFICGHVYHLTCLLDCIEDDNNKDAIERLQKQFLAEGADYAFTGIPSVANKIRHAQSIKSVLGNTGCLVCAPVDANTALSSE